MLRDWKVAAYQDSESITCWKEDVELDKVFANAPKRPRKVLGPKTRDHTGTPIRRHAGFCSEDVKLKIRVWDDFKTADMRS